MKTKVVIVGGGTAGWMTAAYLIRALPWLESITVVESREIKTIGVGEASFSTLKLFLDFLGLHEHDWMPFCNASYKLGIKFVNWAAKDGYFYHPFQRYEVVRGFDAAQWWLKLKPEAPFDQACFTTTAMCEANRSPRRLDGTVFDERVKSFYMTDGAVPNSSMSHHTVQYPYGYHFDAGLLAKFLMKYALDRGVQHVIDDVCDVVFDDEGYIASLVGKQRGNIEGDLFIDCTGFRGLLINQALKEPFISYTDSLPNDRAVAIQVPRDREDDIRPYTTATALSAGWAWTIPLFNRNGTGYVYCSKYITPEQAEQELRKFVGPLCKEASANHISMRIGRCVNSWVKNCVAIGLSSGFVEPLESTAIFVIQHGIEELVKHFPMGRRPTEGQLLSYNSIIADCWDGVREFLTIHYCATDREDTQYWRDTKKLKLPTSLEQRMKMYRAQLPVSRTIYQSFHGFEAYSWSVILLGLNYVPQASLACLDGLDATDANDMFGRIERLSADLVQTFPSQYEYLVRMRTQMAHGTNEPREKTAPGLQGEMVM